MQFNSVFFTTVLSISLGLSACAQKSSEHQPIKSGSETTTTMPTKTAADLRKYSVADFAAGCFWCVEGTFESVKGVQEAISGYAGGNTQNPTYEEVGGGRTGHAESVEVYYDSTVVSYETLLKVFFAGQDPTQVNGQGPDHGTQYRTIIFYRNPAQKKAAEDYIAELTKSGKFDKPIAAQVVPFTKFWEAEGYHQDYIQHNPSNSYVQFESIPRIKRMQKQLPELIKPERNLLK
ncbi:MAG: peptide-methionine (S)-S-oxide reductase MsrA [Bacteroidota bacterium]